jgi:hypothetical protein
VEIAKVVPAYSATEKCGGCGDYIPCGAKCGKTHGKGGLSPLPVVDSERFGAHEGGDYEADPIPEDAITCGACGEVLKALGPCPSCHGIPEEEEQPNDGAPPSPPVARICKGIPIAQGPDEACTCALGPEVRGDRCAMCAEWMRTCGECDGCNGHLPGWNVTGKLCADCRDLRLAQRKRFGADDFKTILSDATEAAWQSLADCEDLDPKTVAVCKRLRDSERGL